MTIPFTPPPPIVTYSVRINSEDWVEYSVPQNSSKFVADNIFYGNEAQVEFRNAKSVQMVRMNFNRRIDAWLRQLGHTAGFWQQSTDCGGIYRLTE